ncbi:class D sortase [Paenibacillaceae bacterium WGS1546]|uniref:class D sortase n=1 Tax=Cohnella sp. WGS1546 TaxID=3366810 RepID=UPI00372D8535
MKKWPYLLIIAGLALLVFPIAREALYDHEQRKLLKELESSAFETDGQAARVRSEYERLAVVFDEDPFGEARAVRKATALQAEEEDFRDAGDRTIAIIEIGKIDLKLPVLEGATAQNLKVGAGHMKETAALGEPGNAAIAAHRARTKGRMFNRLDEVEVGDRIDILTRDKALAYRVTRIKVVEPTDLSVLEAEGDASMLTLITCDPLVNPTHRLIVQATLEDA